jgi:hypothetical protein
MTSLFQTFTINPRAWNYPTGTLGFEVITLDIMARVAILFAYHRGSVRLKGYPATAPNNIGVVRARYRDAGLVTSTTLLRDYSTTTVLDQPGVAAMPMTNMNVIEVQCPFYFRTHTGLVQPGTVIAPNDAQIYYTPTHCAEFRSTGASDLNTYAWTRSASDDFDFGFFLATPRCMQASNYYAVYNESGSIVTW